MAADVLKKALALDPDKRYQTAREFARDLAGHFTAGRSELADLMDTLFPELRREAPMTRSPLNGWEIRIA